MSEWTAEVCECGGLVASCGHSGREPGHQEGEEIAVVPRAERDAALALAERYKEALEAHAFRLEAAARAMRTYGNPGVMDADEAEAEARALRSALSEGTDTKEGKTDG